MSRSPNVVTAEYQLDAVIRLVGVVKLSRVVVEAYASRTQDSGLKRQLGEILQLADSALQAAANHWKVR